MYRVIILRSRKVNLEDVATASLVRDAEIEEIGGVKGEGRGNEGNHRSLEVRTTVGS